MNKATFVRKMEGWTAHAKLYKLEPPYTREPNYEDDEYAGTYDQVIVSAVVAPFTGPEVLVFPADSEGEPINYVELDGYRGGLSHEEALGLMGYEVVE